MQRCILLANLPKAPKPTVETMLRHNRESLKPF
jgi:hypothetical protein